MGDEGRRRFGFGQRHTEEVRAAFTILDCPHQHFMPTSQLIAVCHPVIMDGKFFLKKDNV